MTAPKIVALAGGVGGAKLAYGLYHTILPENLTLIVNTGDDFEHLGLHISPDLDTVMYTLADLANPQTGWGLRDESWGMMHGLARYGGPTWFNLGDQDLATHLLRTMWLKQGQSLQSVTQALCQKLGLNCTLLPMCNEPVRTVVQTTTGELAFQHYFVEQRAQPIVTGLRFAGAAEAQLTPEIITAIEQADLIIFCPSNPMLSIAPILSIPQLRALIQANPAPKIGVSPIIGGQAIKGPAAKMMQELNLDVSPLGVARYLAGVMTHWVIDTIDAAHAATLRELGVGVLVTNTMMTQSADKTHLAEEILAFWHAFNLTSRDTYVTMG